MWTKIFLTFATGGNEPEGRLMLPLIFLVPEVSKCKPVRMQIT